jgi:hypothetical protein
MKPIEVVLRMRSLDSLEEERIDRDNELTLHIIAKQASGHGGEVCHCDRCNLLRDEISKITARVREVRYKESQRGNGH